MVTSGDHVSISTNKPWEGIMPTFTETQFAFFDELYNPEKSLHDIMRELKISTPQLTRWCAAKLFRKRLNRILRALHHTSRIEVTKAAYRCAPKLHLVGDKNVPAATARVVLDMSKPVPKPRPHKHKRKSAFHLIHPDSLANVEELMERIEGKTEEKQGS